VSKRDIHIERLQIRMRGIDARRARAAVSDLGHELLNQLSAPGALDGMRGTVRINKVDAGTAQLKQGIAKQIAGSIKPRINAK